jgi:hypothetical protein
MEITYEASKKSPASFHGPLLFELTYGTWKLNSVTHMAFLLG